MKTLPALLVLPALLLVPPAATGLTREEVMTTARGYAYHPWRATAANLDGGCPAGYTSYYTVGDHLGLPYDWGGYLTLHQFDAAIAAGKAAGSAPYTDVLACNVGLDCSGFVAQTWRQPQIGTYGIPDVSTEVRREDVQAGDAFNQVGYHVILYSHRQANGLPFLYEAMGYSVHPTFTQGWAYVSGYSPRRLHGIEGNDPAEPTGTADRPLEVDTFPFVTSGTTRGAPSDLLDYCGAAPATRELGPEVVYRLVLPTPGRLVVTVQDDAGVDIDVHLYSAFAEGSCLARHDTTLDLQVGCGTYLVVADTWTSADGTEFAGRYDLTIDFTPDPDQPCVPVTEFSFSGRPGAPCAFPGDYDLPFCNESLGATTCLYTGGEPDDVSFCSLTCTADRDCQAVIPGGCCGDIGEEDDYCFTPEFCAGEGEGEGAEGEGEGAEGEGEGAEGEGEGAEGEGEGAEGEGEGAEGEGEGAEGEGEGAEGEGEGAEGEGEGAEGEGEGAEGEGEGAEGEGEGAEGEGTEGEGEGTEGEGEGNADWICEPGNYTSCSCPGEQRGRQFCAADGQSWKACQCAAAEGEGEAAEGEGEGEDDTDRDRDGGCTLAAAGAPPAGLLPWALALLLLGRRARRRVAEPYA
ncbi:MAG: hypothetical protein RBU45_13395 [Myxococcota bacterium]|jgi:hypothetical protein|nr:hypothetical protein [Myxococcota bacterium]